MQVLLQDSQLPITRIMLRRASSSCSLLQKAAALTGCPAILPVQFSVKENVQVQAVAYKVLAAS